MLTIYWIGAVLIFAGCCIYAGYESDANILLVGIAIAFLWPFALPALILYKIGEWIRDMDSRWPQPEEEDDDWEDQ